jgi:hypothetical protein
MIMKKLLGRIRHIFSHSKEDDGNPPMFKATGYWRGTLSFGMVELINRTDGTCSFYALTAPGNGAPMIKGEGRYTIKNGIYRCQIIREKDTVVLETTHVSPGSMSGIGTSSKGGVFIFELLKRI